MFKKLNKIFLIYNTVKYLKPIQVTDRILRFIRGKRTKFECSTSIHLKAIPLYFIPSVESYRAINGNNFTFINLTKEFEENIDWEFPGNGRLWAYNLNYFDYLHQSDMSKENGIMLIESFISHLPESKIGMEAYPISLRCMNWIRFFIKHNINKDNYNSILYSQLKYLLSQIEYHLLGNHLLENGFALFFGAYYFNDDELYAKAKKILISELEEQVLDDGAHFELSPMYHCIMLSRVYDCYNLIQNNNLFEQELLTFFKEIGERMLSWLNTICFTDKTFPLFNDSAFGIAPNVQQLNNYAQLLGYDTSSRSVLKSSGFRKYTVSNMELTLDVGPVGPHYQPGHAHADTFTFELHINNRPVIIDTGTSTYEVNATRFYERSTSAHNTVVVKERNSSQVWAGHRVGKRAEVSIDKEDSISIEATHNGYKSDNVKHMRKVEIQGNDIIITDKIKNNGIAYLHFAPKEDIHLINNSIKGKDFIINLEGVMQAEIFESYFAPEFNKYIKHKSIRITFGNILKTKIQELNN